MKRKIIIALSIFLLLLLFSCTAKPSIDMDNNTNNENNVESMQNNDEDIEDIDPLSDNLPDIDFEGYNFRILMHFENEGLYAEEEIGEPLNDAVYARNITVPITTADYNRTSIIVEALAAEGYKRITPTYYELVLKTKLARDDESAEMLDYIRDGMVVDYGYLNDPLTGQFSLFGTNLYNSKDKSFVSFYEKYADSVKEKINKFIEDNN